MARIGADAIIPTERDAALAEIARRRLAASLSADEPLSLQMTTGGETSLTLELPPAVTRLPSRRTDGNGRRSRGSPRASRSGITAQQAADLLNVSRRYLVGVIDAGVLPTRKVGNQRRIPLKQALAYKAEQFAQRSEALRLLVAHDQELGLE